MPYSNVTGRGSTSALVPEEVSNSMLGNIVGGASAVLSAFRRIPVSASQVRFPILSALPVAYWVAGDTGQKQTTEQSWANKFLNIEELAVIVPVPENVLDDVSSGGGFDLWSEIQPAVEQAIVRTFDSAVFFGTNAPATFPTNIKAMVDSVQAATTSGMVRTAGTSAVGAGGIQDDIDEIVGALEPMGFDPSAIIANRTLKGKLRRARNTLGERLSGISPALDAYLDMNIVYPMRGMFPTGTGSPLAFIGDFTEFVVGIRKDISFKLLDQAVLQDNTGAITLNLPQQDMVALRFTFRAGWQVSNQIRYDQTDPTKRYPVGYLAN